MASKIVSLQAIADAAGVSRSTVSLALRRSPLLSTETAESIRRTAEKLGYSPNPMVSALMAHRRGARNLKLKFTIGAIITEGKGEMSPFLQLLLKGCRTSATTHGYAFELFKLEDVNLPDSRLSKLIYHSNIPGIIITPISGQFRRLELDWDQFSSVMVGYSHSEPQLHRVDSHLFRAMRLAIKKLKEKGYKKIGLCMPFSRDEGVYNQWTAAYLHEQFREQHRIAIPPLTPKDEEYTFANFATWFKKYKPDAILSSDARYIVPFLKQQRLKYPKQLGIALLDVTPEAPGKFSGIKFDVVELGRVTTDFLVGMIQRGEKGIPQLPQHVLLDPMWTDGESTR